MVRGAPPSLADLPHEPRGRGGSGPRTNEVIVQKSIPVRMLSRLVFVSSLVVGPHPGLSATPADRAQCPHFVAGSDGLPTHGEWRTHPAVGDVNGDGHLDIAGHPRKAPGPRVWLGDGTGKWTAASRGLAIPGKGCGVGVAFADVDSDGNLDLGVADHCSGLFVFLGDGKGSWRLAPIVGAADRRGFEDLTFADINGDGHQDMVAVSTFRGGVVLFAGDGTGRFAVQDVGLPETGFAKDVKVRDINGDGRLDIAATYSAGIEVPKPGTPSRNVVWLSGVDSRYVPGSRGIPSTDGQWTGVALGDVNGDGWLDLALSSTYHPGRPSLLVYLGDGHGNWTPSLDGLPPAPAAPAGWDPYWGVELADFNRDGNLDLVAIGSRSASIEIFLGDGEGGWRACEGTGLPGKREKLRGWGVSVADVNHDDKLDIIAGFGRKRAGAIEVWLQQ